jgi:uncharacterized protein (TIGR03437 family)
MKNILALGSFCVVFAHAHTITLMSAASYQQNAAISPGAIIAIKGTGMANVTMSAPDPTHPPTTLGNVTLTINGVPCGLYYVSPTQINAVLDASVTDPNALVVVQSDAGTFTTSTTITSPSSAGLFSLTGTGSGDGAILNAANYLNTGFSTTSGGAPTTLALFLTSLNPSVTPTVWLGGISAPVVYAGPQGTYPGMQQINIQIPPALQGAGRVELVVEQNGLRSNAVEAVILPQQPVFSGDQPNQTRSRELAAVAWVPGTNLALLADENDDVVRVLDMSQGKITHVIALPDGAEPQSIGVHGSGAWAVVAQRGRGSIALLDLTAFNVAGEFPTGLGACAVAIAGDEAVIANADDDTVSFFTFRAQFGQPALQVTATVPVGRLPHAIGVDAKHAYVSNESAGSISVLDLVSQVVVNTFNLGVNVRPGAIQVLDDVGFAMIAEPSAGPGGKLIFLNIATGQFTSVQANPDQTGGASSIVAVGDRLYMANQTGGTITTTPVAVPPGSQLSPASVQMSPVNFKVDLGTRSLSLDPAANWLLSANEGTGTIVATDLTSNKVISRFDALRTSPADNVDDHSDRLAAPNMPTIASITPASGSATGISNSLSVTVTGTNLTGAEGVLFIDPATISGITRGNGNVNRGNEGVTDPAIVVSNIQVNATGTAVTAQLQIAANTQPRTRVVRVLTPNGETSLTNAPTFAVK